MKPPSKGRPEMGNGRRGGRTIPRRLLHSLESQGFAVQALERALLLLPQPMPDGGGRRGPWRPGRGPRSRGGMQAGRAGQSGLEAVLESLWGKASSNGGPGEREGLRAQVARVAGEVERWLIARALEESRYNRTEAARRLRISRKTLFNKLRSLGMPLRGTPAGTRPGGWDRGGRR